MPVEVVRLGRARRSSGPGYGPCRQGRPGCFCIPAAGNNAAHRPFCFKPGEIEVVADAADFQPGAHNLLYGDAAEIEQPFENIPFFVGSVILCNLVDLALKLLGAEGADLCSPQRAFETFRPMDGPSSYPSEEQVDELDHAGGVVGKLKIVLGRPDLWA